MAFAISALSFVVIACERYMQIIHNKKISVKQLCGMWAIAWSSSIIQAVIPVATSTYFVPQDSHWYCLGNFKGSTPSHRAYSIFSLVSAVAACGIIAFAYYSIYKKVIGERYKWKDIGFTLKTATPSAFDNTATNPPNLRSSTISKGTEAVPSPNVSNSNKSAVPTHGEHANVQQMRLTLRLAFYSFYFLTMWTGSILSWTYQTITLNKVSPYLEYGITMVPFLVCVMHPILVFTIDPRWKIQLPHLLEYFVSRKTNSS
ncbi:hypothetical protein BKA69DRAFT_1037458 [Paraphysoderma sedebokerense]|nr:hypothetical protein BKA69DRAFT_1037458 [Paraphysoderma sedebokerense]